MTEINVHEAKAHLSKYLAKVERGETIIVCRHNKPIAEICPLKKPKGKRPLGLAKGEGHVPPAFFDPLPEDWMNAFYGKGK